MQLTSEQINSITQTMKDETELLFDKMQYHFENPDSLDDLKNQLSWLEILDKSKQSINILGDYVGKGAAILFVNGKLLSVKWYNIFGLIKLITVGKLFVDLIIEVYKIWSFKNEK
jgi:hypothetical protein